MADTNTTGKRDATRKMYKLIEDVARAIETAKAHPGDCLVEVQAQRALAVVLASLREPSEGMLEAVCTAIECEPNSSEAQGRAAIKAFVSQWAKEQGIE